LKRYQPLRRACEIIVQKGFDQLWVAAQKQWDDRISLQFRDQIAGVKGKPHFCTVARCIGKSFCQPVVCHQHDRDGNHKKRRNNRTHHP
jgi:hypothetical protein